MEQIKAKDLLAIIEGWHHRSKWDRAIDEDAYSLVCNASNDGEPDFVFRFGSLEKQLLSGAADWRAYSYGGCALVYDGDIAEHYCTPSQFKKSREGQYNPNRYENWLDLQARALYRAYCRIRSAIRNN